VRFLIVSQDDQQRHRLGEALRARGLIIDERDCAGAPVGAAPDRIIVDVTRAPAPGAAMAPLIRDLRAAWPGVPLIVLAAYPSAALMHVALRLGADHCLAATTDADQLLLAFAQTEGPIDPAAPGPYGFATLDEARWQHIGRALEVSRGNISGAARLLGIHRQSLQRILRSLRFETSAAPSGPTSMDAAG
jgi:two-component system, response regulator RegA